MSNFYKDFKITIFEKGHRPKENLYGILFAGIKNKKINSIVIRNLFSRSVNISKLNVNDIENFSSHFSKNINLLFFFHNLLHIYKSNLIFGKFPISLRIILFLLNWKGHYICVPPGKITKAVGFYKSGWISNLRIIKNIVSHKILKTIVLSCDEIDKIYLSASNGYPIVSLINSKLPKHLWINRQLNLNSNSLNQNKILFAPTERRKGDPSPITKLLEEKLFVKKIIKTGLQIEYSHHIHDLNKIQNIRKEIRKFSGNWQGIDILVTDYSSIGADFLLSGGTKVIYFTIDKLAFTRDYGNGPLFELEMQNGTECADKESLLKTIFNFKDNSKGEGSLKVDHGKFFELISSKINKKK